MTDSRIHIEIDRLLASLDGELTTHSRVIDGLLDLRCAAQDVRLVAIIDASLRTVPGRTAVATEWWKDQLTDFQVLVELAHLQPPSDVQTTTVVTTWTGTSATVVSELS